MSTNSPQELISGNLKLFEEQIVSFYQSVGDKTALNSKATRIFAYLQVYGTLTQKQLKKLTNFSSSTISTTLNSFVQNGIVSREIGINARLGLYKLKSEKVPMIYTEFSEVIKELESFDKYIVSIQVKVSKFQKNYPNFSKFIHHRLNSYRNYIETQRRAIDNAQKFPFFQENTSHLGFGNTIVEFPRELNEIGQNFVTSISENAIYAKDDTISNIIFNYLGIHGSITQEMLVQLTGLSLSTISRYLNQFVKDKVVLALPKQYKQSRIYQLPSISLSIIHQILEADDSIFKWKPKFQKMLVILKNSDYKPSDSLDLLTNKISNLINQISDFRPGSNRLVKARNELLRKFEQKK